MIRIVGALALTRLALIRAANVEGVLGKNGSVAGRGRKELKEGGKEGVE